MIVYLVDNGSLRVDSWRNLQRVAAALASESGHDVRPASLLHSNKIPAAETDGAAPVLVESEIRREIAAGQRSFCILPFFFGPSRAITRYLPERIAKVQEEFPDVSVRIAPYLFAGDKEQNFTLARILADQIRETIRKQAIERPPVILVDHGSPVPAVTRVRDVLAGQLSVILGDEVACVGPSSMERREGPLYAFNEPLLERRLSKSPYNNGDVVISLLFLSPGRHAGAGGDIAEICRLAEESYPGLRTHMTPLVGEHPNIVTLLSRRLEQATGRDS